jgi:hypothetical protein
MAAFTPSKTLMQVDNIFEAIFYISFALNFIVDFKIEGQKRPVRDLKEIGLRYLKGNFLFDLIPIIPFVNIFNFNNGREKVLYSVKILRLITGI